MLPQVKREIFKSSRICGYCKNLSIIIDIEEGCRKTYKGKTDDRFFGVFYNPRKYGGSYGGYYSNNKGCTFPAGQYQKQNYKESTCGRAYQICCVEFASYGRKSAKS